MKTVPDREKDEVLYAFSVEPKRNSALLEEYIKAYPQYRDLLIDLSIELSLIPEQVEMQVNGEISENIESSWAKFQSMLDPTDPVSLSVTVVKNPLEALDNQSFRLLAKQLNMSRLFLTRLRDRTIKVSTLPMQLVAKMANEVGTEVESMWDSLGTHATISPSVRFKADVKPTADRQMTFDDAIENSNLSEEQKSELRAMKE